MANLTEHFTTDEFKCKHCGLMVKIDQQLLEKLEKLRELSGGPIVVTSGYRCPQHNAAIGGARDSYHVKGMAADIKSAGISPEKLAEMADKIGFSGIGIYASWVHLDTREKPAKWRG